jgi:hypothetical protein
MVAALHAANPDTAKARPVVEDGVTE